ncbi:MAG: hypothetical protein ACRC2R_22230 [Xenococcaceae cyanobacterium]
MVKIVMPQGDRKFILYENQAPGQFLNLDFSTFGVDKGVIVHWQSKPAPYREWGLYDASADTYTSCPHFSIADGVKANAIQLPNGWGYVPSAVLHFDGEVKVGEDGSIAIAPLQPVLEYQI